MSLFRDPVAHVTSLIGAVLIGRRAAALALNLVLFVALAVAGVLVIPAVADIAEVGFLASVLLYVVVIDLVPTSLTAATPGHHALRLRIARTDGARVTFGRGSARALAYAAAVVVAVALAALPAFVFGLYGYPLVSDWTQVLDAATAFDGPVPTLGVVAAGLVAPLFFIPGGRGWHEILSGTTVVSLGSAPRIPSTSGVRWRWPIVLGGTLAASVAVATLPAVVAAGRLSTLDACLTQIERGGASERGFAAQGPDGTSSLGVRRPAPPGLVVDPWWVFAPHERTTLTFADGSHGERIVALSARGGAPGPGPLGFRVETSFRAGGLAWLLYSTGSPRIAERHDALASCIQARLAGT